MLNGNPELGALTAEVNGGFSSDFLLRAGQPIRLSVAWPASARQDYVWLPPDGTSVEPRREALRVSWFTSSGTFASSATGGEPDTTATFSSNTFTPDASSDRVDVWAVLQDDRGGSAAQHWRLQVER